MMCFYRSTMARDLDRIRAYRRAHKLSRAAFARLAGLHANTLRNIDGAAWRPTLDTLDKLDAVIPADWLPDQITPSGDEQPSRSMVPENSEAA